ncbi:putative immunity protein [Sanguibacter antarcticus]|uniref:Rifampin ADP-ribosylating transferase n=1 Tax=Sanguibacter antarcticus TaxID=372484 RepID=A0A2A9E4C9_9MICO|nr:exonuclease SbcC [Sanguibacter antarcticus]PFG33050.1 rifampin ADP-ribosylating transferase [Sanguibacter antarcticus]
MAAVNGKAVELTMEELRAVARFAADCAESVLPDFEAEAPENSRPREALHAARVFAEGGARTNLQRTAAFAAHRAAQSVSAETAQLAALACGDAAASAYLHPIAEATQVGHILRAAACAARVAELRADDEGTTSSDSVGVLVERAAPPVPDVLRRYPAAPHGASRLSRLMSALDTAIRQRTSEAKPIDDERSNEGRTDSR